MDNHYNVIDLRDATWNTCDHDNLYENARVVWKGNGDLYLGSLNCKEYDDSIPSGYVPSSKTNSTKLQSFTCTDDPPTWLYKFNCSDNSTCEEVFHVKMYGPTNTFFFNSSEPLKEIDFYKYPTCFAIRAGLTIAWLIIAVGICIGLLFIGCGCACLIAHCQSISFRKWSLRKKQNERSFQI